MHQHKIIAFIGAGNMARAMITGLLQNGFHANHIWASSPNIHKHTLIIHTTPDNLEAARHADVIVFAVKPLLMQTVCLELSDIIRAKKPLLISIATGIKTSTMAEWIGEHHCAMVRAMPNIAAAVGAGAAGLFANTYTTDAQKTFAESLFRSVGAVVWTDDENQMDVITAVSGSGPAYLFYVFEAMQTTAESLGIAPEQAKLLVAQTAIGAAKMVMETPESFQQLRRFVTSEKGTTAAAVAVFDQYEMQNIIKEAIQAAWMRAVELSR